MGTEIIRGTRHSKIIGDFGEHLICNWLSRSGFEVSRVDHTGIDVVAYNPSAGRRYGITVKSRTRTSGKESESVYVFRKDDRKKMADACEAFGCEPWIAVYVESEHTADLYLTSLENYDDKYRAAGESGIDAWNMTTQRVQEYAADASVRHIHIAFTDENWWRLSDGQQEKNIPAATAKVLEALESLNGTPGENLTSRDHLVVRVLIEGIRASIECSWTFLLEGHTVLAASYLERWGIWPSSSQLSSSDYQSSLHNPEVPCIKS